MALESSAESPIPVRSVANAIGQWVGRLGRVWVDGQLTQITRRPGTNTVFFVLRDPAADISLNVTAARQLIDGMADQLTEGSRVVVWAKPEFYLARGSLQLHALEIRPVGVGELLARIERLKRLLASEGLFDPNRKRRLPFLPGTIGLICGRESAAERDVLENARRRWPAVQFRVEAVAVQGSYAVTEIVKALQTLDADPNVEVIVIARGGGSVEDLLPFSDEALLRAASACRTPIVSAIGHEPDSPLLDLVADVRASTPTDAGKLIVPDVAEEQRRITLLRDRALRYVATRVEREQDALRSLRARPVLATPERDLDRRAHDLLDLLSRARRSLGAGLDRAADDVTHLLARVRSLSPAATLERGYAVVQDADGRVMRSAADVNPGALIGVRLASGKLTAAVVSAEPGSTV
ncbi:MAG TPA: exodeoxyribonuclease VII large subunit [Solirubrobacteraceae bacterium]|nr:exodeoxyribonuclease VII large subunit [Solirubrobacteraceae bacterium]